MGWQIWPADGLNPAFTTDGGAVTHLPALARAVWARSRAPQALMANAAKSVIERPCRMAPAPTYVGAIVREKISANEPLIASKVVKPGGSGVMAVTLDPGMRAVALPLTAESAAGGFILPGDHVDVLMTRQTRRHAGLRQSRAMVSRPLR